MWRQTYEQRLHRYFHRSNELDLLKISEAFDEVANHPVELETKSIKRAM
jgi:hypothetical protein